MYIQNNRVADGKSSNFGTNKGKSSFSASQSGFSVPKMDSTLEQLLEQPTDIWLCRHPELMNLAWTFYLLALEYKLRWADFWPDRWGDWDWVKKAMGQTYINLNAEDKSGIREFYEAFIERVEFYDEIAML